MQGVTRCLDDLELLALIERRLTHAARDVAFVHIDACRACLELVTELLRGELLGNARLEQTLE